MGKWTGLRQRAWRNFAFHAFKQSRFPSFHLVEICNELSRVCEILLPEATGLFFHDRRSKTYQVWDDLGHLSNLSHLHIFHCYLTATHIQKPYSKTSQKPPLPTYPAFHPHPGLPPLLQVVHGAQQPFELPPAQHQDFHLPAGAFFVRKRRLFSRGLRFHTFSYVFIRFLVALGTRKDEDSALKLGRSVFVLNSSCKQYDIASHMLPCAVQTCLNTSDGEVSAIVENACITLVWRTGKNLDRAMKSLEQLEGTRIFIRFGFWMDLVVSVVLPVIFLAGLNLSYERSQPSLSFFRSEIQEVHGSWGAPCKAITVQAQGVNHISHRI